MSYDYFSEFEAQQAKLEALLDDNNLLHEFVTDAYPITLLIRPNVVPDAQMAMYAQATEGVSSRDAKLVFQFLVGEINVRVYGRLIISDALMSKIKGQAKKMLLLWLQGDHAARMEQLGYATQEAEDDGSNVTDFDEFYEADSQEDE